ncbi:hypothetical protein KUV57_11670 [Epibacterium sp. DP7N7-1]|nr:hypothetical protein [Epibacterium sp. DP7N7-1]
MTIDDVIEKHRLACGADTLRVSLAPGATPEGVDRELARLNEATQNWSAFRPEEIEASKVARLHDLLDEINTLARKGDTGRILELTDIHVDVDLEVDTAWMRAAREKRGEPLPATA